MAGDFMAAIALAQLLNLRPPAAAAVEMKGSLHAVAIEQLRQPRIVLGAVVIAERDPALFPLRIAMKLQHLKTSFFRQPSPGALGSVEPP